MESEIAIREACVAQKLDMKEQVSTLKERIEERESALLAWGKQVRQMFFYPERAVEELTWKIEKHWRFPRKAYWLKINGRHESQVQECPRNPQLRSRYVV
jgi:hypothetical protein